MMSSPEKVGAGEAGEVLLKGSKQSICATTLTQPSCLQLKPCPYTIVVVESNSIFLIFQVIFSTTPSQIFAIYC